MNQNKTLAFPYFLIRLLAGCAGLGLACGLLIGSTALAAPVNAQTAANAVLGWLRLDHQPMGSRMSASVHHTETVHDAAGAALYHVVHLDPAGYVIVPADDMAEPVIAFSASGQFVASSSDPVAALVNRDLPRRMARARAGGPDARAAEAHRKWQRMLAASPNPPPDSEENDAIVITSQVWVAPFVQTLWSQNNDVSGNYAVYDYYVPPNGPGSVNNDPCGCVATCLAQLMYYFQYPTLGVGTNSFSITNNGVEQSAHLLGGNGAGGPYQWSNMPLSPDSPTTAQAQAIGALCSDAGVVVNMDYAPNGSSAFTYAAQRALTNTFMFSNAGFDENDAAGLSGPSLLAMINPNLDARLPVSLAINGTAGGHCLIVDGYGYTGSTLFHHINAGWGGDDDVWYALPNINTPDNAAYNIVQACIYNIYTNGAGQIISGRITDPTGAPVVGAAVTANRTAGGSYTATTDANGIYALVRIPANSQYALTATNTGYSAATGNYATGISTYNTTNSGNVWGANFTLSPPLLAMPETGFAAVGPFAGPFSVTAQTYTLTNTTASAVSWALSNTASWLSVTTSNGSVATGAASSLTVSVNAAASSLAEGNYSAMVFITNLNNHLAQSLTFTLSVKIANYPIAVTGFNADVVVENAAIGGNTYNYADTFDPVYPFLAPPGPICFYESGLVAQDLYGGAAVLGLPTNGLFTSLVDNATTFQFAPYDSANVLYLTLASNSGSLALNSPAAYKSLSVLAASAQGGGNGTLVIHFADGTINSALVFNAANYLVTNTAGSGAAITNFGMLATGADNEFGSLDNTFGVFPCLYQTSINLQSLGLHTKQIASVTFTMPGGANTNMVTGIFALSGTESPFPIITSQPQSVAVAGGANAAFSVGAAGAATLSYQWHLNGSSLTGAQSNTLNLAGAGAANAGSYQVVITNASGTVTSTVALLSITNQPVSFLTGGSALKLSGGALTLQLTNLTGQGPVVVSASTNLLQWIPIFTNPSGFGTFTVTDTAAGSFLSRYYRATTP
jgi:hypothetical protein